MSFHQNNSRRYGYIPPAQYGDQASTNSNHSLRRQTSFDNGDDASLFHRDGRPGASPARGSTGGGYSPAPPDELFMSGNHSTQAPLPSSRPYFSSNSSAFAGYQHQYQPVPDTSQVTTPLQSAYNPQQFARTNSVTQPQTLQQVSTYNSAAAYGAHQPYNPAAYPPQSPQRPSTSSSYGYGLPQVPQSPVFWTPAQYTTSPQLPARSPSHAAYDQPTHQNPYAPAGSAPLPPRPSPYSPTQSSHFSANGGGYAMNDQRPQLSASLPYPDQDAMPIGTFSPDFYNESSSFSNSARHNSGASNYSNSGYGVTPGSDMSPSSGGLQRHPTLRPLPSAPVDEENEAGWDYASGEKSAEEIAQERIYQDIENAVMPGRTGSRPLPLPVSGPSNGDLLDNELGDLPRRSSQATNSNGRQADYEFDDDDSDIEAAAGLEAMRIADEQDGMLFGSPAIPQEPVPTQDASSDSDYANIDMGLYGGGYDAHMSYGDNLFPSQGNRSEIDDQSRPLPLPHELRKSNEYNPPAGLGGMTDYSVPTETPYQYPNNASAPADAYGNEGSQRPRTGHRLSFDAGDEQYNLQYRAPSRESGRSGNESPFKDDIPEMFYHPGMSSTVPAQRPLPAIPPPDEATPQIASPALSRGSSQDFQHHYARSFDSTAPTLYHTQDSEYPPQTMLNPSGPFVPRSASLSSHTNTPQAVPPVRSKTDAEERQARQKLYRQQMLRSGALDNYETSASQSSVTLDLPTLPAGRRRKFNPEKLTADDVRRCKEPWALSQVAAWLKEMAGGDTGEGETDLREKTIFDGLVALFTTKVPNMNIADAEALSALIVREMFDAGVLVRDEEWVKFGQGSVSGVMWQLTGSGCYAPRLHALGESESLGQCYSHHCTRTARKLDLDAQALEPARKAQDWATYWQITAEKLEEVRSSNKKEIERQNNLHEIVQSEDTYMDQLNVLLVLYRDSLIKTQPPIISPQKVSRFVSSVFGKADMIHKVNKDYLLTMLKYRQKMEGPWIKGFSDIFRDWIRRAKQPYIDYAAGFPNAQFLIRKEADRNILFQDFLNKARENTLSKRLDWNTYLKAPITRLQRYGLLLDTVLKHMPHESEEKTNLATAIEEIKKVTMECDAKVDEMQKKVEMQELGQKLFLRPGMERVELNLDHLGRELLFKGDLQRPGTNRFQWLETHALLFDNYLVLAKTVLQRDINGARKKEVYDVSKLPIPMQLLVLESSNDDPVVKSTMKGIAVTRQVAATSDTASTIARASSDRPFPLEHTNTNTSVASTSSGRNIAGPTNLDADAKIMYPFRIKHLGKTEVYTLYAPTAQNRQDWCDKIIEAKTKHARALHEQNAEPFRLRVLADTAFAYDGLTNGSRTNSDPIPGTPLDRAVREVESQYGAVRQNPVCRAQVNCAAAFTWNNKSMIAIGTDYAVYTAEVNDTRGWTRAMVTPRVTQISILEEFSLCLVISDRALIAYPLDVVVPGTSSLSNDSTRRAPQKLSGSKDVNFFATARMKDRILVFYKKKDGLHSVFKVLEPVFQKSSDKQRNRVFGMRKSGQTEFFREFDDFYIPTDCFTINLFHSSIAISTPRGFELLTLDKKVPMSVPDLKNPAAASIAARIAAQKPLGMFRLNDQEYLLCYETCAVYIDKHGDVSRSVVLEFVGKAKSAAMYGKFLVLFDSDFVEVRNAENGRLRQVIAGRDIRCLDYGVPVSGPAPPQAQAAIGIEQRTLKLAMVHPEYPQVQLVAELLLNKDQRE